MKQFRIEVLRSDGYRSDEDWDFWQDYPRTPEWAIREYLEQTQTAFPDFQFRLLSREVSDWVPVDDG